MGMRELGALLNCLVTVSVLWLFLTVPWVVLGCVIAVFSDHTHLIVLSLIFGLCRLNI